MTALNEQDNIQEAITQMHKTLSLNLGEFSIVVIDDGSSDRTYELASALDFPELTVLRNSLNLGTGKSIRSYLPYINTDFYCWYPSDLELSPLEISKLIPSMNEFDIVVSFLLGDQRSKVRRILSDTFTKILNLSFSNDLPYYNGVSLIKRELLPDSKLISSHRFFTHAEILILSLKENIKVKTVGLNLYPRGSGESKAMRLNAFSDVFINFIRLMSKKMRQ